MDEAWAALRFLQIRASELPPTNPIRERLSRAATELQQQLNINNITEPATDKLAVLRVYDRAAAKYAREHTHGILQDGDITAFHALPPFNLVREGTNQLIVSKWVMFQQWLMRAALTTQDPLPPCVYKYEEKERKTYNEKCTMSEFQSLENLEPHQAHMSAYKNPLMRLELVDGFYAYEPSIFLRGNPESYAIDIRDIFDLCAKNNVVVLATTMNSGHVTALTCWIDRITNANWIAWYDPLYINSIHHEEIALLRTLEGVSVINVSDSCNHLTNGSIRCPQFYINSQLCAYYSIFFLMNVMRAKNFSPQNDNMNDVLNTALEFTYIVPRNTLSRESNVESIVFKVVTLSFTLTLLSLQWAAIFGAIGGISNYTHTSDVIERIKRFTDDWAPQHSYNLVDDSVQQLVNSIIQSHTGGGASKRKKQRVSLRRAPLATLHALAVILKWRPKREALVQHVNARETTLSVSRIKRIAMDTIRDMAYSTGWLPKRADLLEYIIRKTNKSRGQRGQH